MASPVLDSFALLAFLFKEKGHQKIVDVFDQAVERDEAALIASPNWAEVRYIVQRKVGMQRWSEVRSTILALPMQIVTANQVLAEAADASADGVDLRHQDEPVVSRAAPAANDQIM